MIEIHKTPPSSQPIKTLPELILRLQAIRTDLDARHLTLRQYEHVGWAARPLQSLLDRCREEAESSSSARRCEQIYRSLWPHLPSSRALSSGASANTNHAANEGASP